MAQGYINSKGNMEMEVKAEHYFENLAMRSFFQDFEKDGNDGKIVSCKMHDIVHNFAKSMAKDVCFTINYSGDKVEKDFKRARHLSLIIKETFPEFVYEAKNLRFLNLDFISSPIVQPKLFDHLTCLRTLHLEGESILELPNEVEKLIHLRLLKLSCIKIKELPESICNLCNLQSLDVSGCWKLEKLPKGIGKLFNLRHLLIDGIRIKSFPKGIGRLTCLKTLGYFPVGGKGEEICKLGELEHLNHIQGKLEIYGLSDVVDSGAIENTLKKKKDLRDLVLYFKTLEEEPEEEEETEEEEEEEETEEERRRKMEKDVAILNALEPPPRLESLHIVSYKGTTMYPNWMMSKLTYLKSLMIEFYPNLEQLPPLGKLPLLEELVIDIARMIRKVGDEFLGIDIEEEELSESSKDIIIFPNLKSLEFTQMDSWEEWSGMGGTIEEEEEKDNSANAFVTNNTPKIQIMPLLHSLQIGWCYKLKSLPDYLRNTPLQELHIYGYEGTAMYPNWMMSKLTYLKKLYLDECPNLEQLPPLGKLPLLEELEIREAPMIRKVGDEFLGIDIEEEELSESSKNNNNKDIIILFPNLKSLIFKSLWTWKEWSGMGGTIEEEEEKDNSANAFVTNNTPKIQIMPRLHSLTIWDCGNLKSLPDYLRNTPLLKELEIWVCPILKQRFERGIGSYWPNISHIPNIQIDFKYVQKDGQLPDRQH
ncbi:disease resistance protein RGA2-like [Quercus lobata]|uniref:disease resistance protein RGA2-like n=1 Tax=Quercus lobata TaxID=97700 RepID=UPI00124915EA|nr:disease resistance protein RGA2-like [Quercus lobata]